MDTNKPLNKVSLKMDTAEDLMHIFFLFMVLKINNLPLKDIWHTQERAS